MCRGFPYLANICCYVVNIHDIIVIHCQLGSSRDLFLCSELQLELLLDDFFHHAQRDNTHSMQGGFIWNLVTWSATMPQDFLTRN